VIYDAAGRKVRDLGDAWGLGPFASLSVEPDVFSPAEGPCVIACGALRWSWHGESDAGEPAPNGFYKVVVTTTDKSEVSGNLTLRRTTVPGERPLAAPDPARDRVFFTLKPPSGWDAELSVYSLSGERVVRFAPGPGVLSVAWDLRSPAGDPVAAGIYLVEAIYSTHGTRQYARTKLAVLR
jgi:flagellar hook assembly protein FlgD